MISIKRTTFAEPDFNALITELDRDLALRYGEKQSQYDGLNKGLEKANVVVALSDSQPVGCACYKPLEEDGIVEIKRMYVQSTARQKGIAQQLLTELEHWARESGYTKAMLQTANKQPEAVALYNKWGYQIIDCYGPYQDDADSICMEKLL